jgi:hypothetical protein
MSGREKRQVQVVGKGGRRVKNALAELAELRRTGGKRADTYEVEEEADVYDEVDEAEYARIVQRRREEGGAPIESRRRRRALPLALPFDRRRREAWTRAPRSAPRQTCSALRARRLTRRPPPDPPPAA